MKTIAAGKFKATCLALIDEIEKKREPVIITKHGRPAAKMIPIETEQDPIFGSLRNKIWTVGDAVSPAVPLEDYECLK